MVPKDGQISISPIWQVAAASAAATSATPTPARTPASVREGRRESGGNLLLVRVQGRVREQALRGQAPR